MVEVSKDRDGVVVKVVFNEEEKSIKAEKLLLSVGRKASTSSLSFEKAAVKLGVRKEIVVNNKMKVLDGIWAAGDVTVEPMLETVAAREGMIAASNALSSEKIKMDYTVIPREVFTDPQLATAQSFKRDISKMSCCVE